MTGDDEVDALACSGEEEVKPTEVAEEDHTAYLWSVSSPELGCNPFVRQMDLLDSRIERVPLGWQRLYADMRLALRAVRCEQRRQTALFGPEFLPSAGMEIGVLNADRTVEGIVRKAMRRSLQTCECCGGRAKVRQIGFCCKVLCATCGALPMLEAELEALVREVDRKSDSESAGSRDVMQISPRVRALIDRGLWRPQAGDCSRHSQWCVNDEDLQRMIPSFRRVIDRIRSEGDQKG